MQRDDTCAVVAIVIGLAMAIWQATQGQPLWLLWMISMIVCAAADAARQRMEAYHKTDAISRSLTGHGLRDRWN